MKNNNSQIGWPKLPKAFKNKWIKALRSGKYEQIQGRLIKDKGYCCLGVACSVLKYHNRFVSNHITIPKNYNRVPIALRGDALTNDLVEHLSDMNDGVGEGKKSFKQIANFIEKYL